MQPKYEEKTFESYFNTELDRRSKIYFPFGQVQEGGIGADAAGFSRSKWLWQHFALANRNFRGVNLRDVADEMERHLSREIKTYRQLNAIYYSNIKDQS